MLLLPYHPGPWRIEGRKIVTPCGPIATVRKFKKGLEGMEAADVALLRAAPRLYETLKYLLNDLELYDDFIIYEDDDSDYDPPPADETEEERADRYHRNACRSIRERISDALELLQDIDKDATTTVRSR